MFWLEAYSRSGGARSELPNALPIVAAALGRKFGVTVAVGGPRACTDGTVIQLPDLPEDPAVRDLAWGYLAHEAAHVRYTDLGSRQALRRATAGPRPRGRPPDL